MSGVAPVPGKSSLKNSENLNIWMLGNTERGRDNAWDFMKFMTNGDSMRSWVQVTGSQPARPDVLDDWINLHSSHMSAEDIKTLVNENIQRTVESADHMVVDFYRFDDAYTQGVSTLWDGQTNVKDFFIYYLFQNAFVYFRMGLASAQAWVLFVIILTLTIVAFWSQRYWVYYESAVEDRT